VLRERDPFNRRGERTFIWREEFNLHYHYILKETIKMEEGSLFCIWEGEKGDKNAPTCSQEKKEEGGSFHHFDVRKKDEEKAMRLFRSAARKGRGEGKRKRLLTTTGAGKSISPSLGNQYNQGRIRGLFG